MKTSTCTWLSIRILVQRWHISLTGDKGLLGRKHAPVNNHSTTAVLICWHYRVWSGSSQKPDLEAPLLRVPWSPVEDVSQYIKGSEGLGEACTRPSSRQAISTAFLPVILMIVRRAYQEKVTIAQRF